MQDRPVSNSIVKPLWDKPTSPRPASSSAGFSTHSLKQAIFWQRRMDRATFIPMG